MEVTPLIHFIIPQFEANTWSILYIVNRDTIRLVTDLGHLIIIHAGNTRGYRGLKKIQLLIRVSTELSTRAIT